MEKRDDTDDSLVYLFPQQTFDNQIEEERYLTCKEASRFLGVTPNSLRIKVHRGQVRAFRLQNRLRFKKEDLEEAIEKK